MKQVRKHQVMRLSGTKARNINELEFWRGRVVANVWYEKVLLIINPQSGLVEKEYGTCDYCIYRESMVQSMSLSCCGIAYISMLCGKQTSHPSGLQQGKP